MGYLNPHTHDLSTPEGVGQLVADIATLGRTASVLDEIAAERQRQDAKWGEQNHPDGNPADYYTGRAEFAAQADRWKLINSERAGRKATAWDGVLLEEVFEALAEADPVTLRAELVQVAAVAVAWIEAIDRRAE